ncbi:MAG: hypothetical protein ACTSPB_00765 [Candidatus Thorarchaeota archaeon]
MARRGKGSGWFGDHRRHVLAGKGVSTKLPDGRRLDVSNYVASGYVVGRKYNVAGFVREFGEWRWGHAFKDDEGVWFFTPDGSSMTFELKPRHIKVYGECSKW